MLVVPALLDIRHDWRALTADRSRRWIALAALAGLLLVEAPVFWFRDYELLFAILLIFVAIGFRLGRTVSALATLSTIVLADVLLNFGHPRAVLLFGNLTLDEKLYAQVFLAGCALATIPMAGAIARQKALEAALVASRADALAASDAKSQFLANMSHEIRTPLTGVLGFAGLLEAMTNLPQDARTYAERIVTGGRSLLAAVNDILDFSKLDADRIELDPHAFDPAALIGEAVNLIASEAARKELRLDTEITGDMPTVFADSSRVRQVLLNLLGNAPLLDGTNTYVQCSRDDFEAILNYSQHVASFKMGGAEFMATMPMLKGFYQAAANVNRRWATMGVFVEMLKAQGRKQEEAEPKEVHESA